MFNLLKKVNPLKKRQLLIILMFGLVGMGASTITPTPLQAPTTETLPESSEGPIKVITEFQSENKKILKTGWFTWDPYQYLIEEQTNKTLTGFDVELARMFAGKLNYKIQYIQDSWLDNLKSVQEGTLDFLMGATYTDERNEYAYFSIPYRYEEDSLFVLREKFNQYQFKTIDEMLNYFRDHNLRLGVIAGYVYAWPGINQFIHDPKNKDVLDFTQDDYENLNKLLNREIDGFIADRIVGATAIWRTQQGSKVAERRLGVKVPIHMMFSKKTVTPALVSAFNESIKSVKATEKYEKIVAWYLYPVLLLQTVNTDWFQLIDIIGIMAFAISGLIIAYRDKSTLWGAFVFAILPSLGGGLMRDVIIGRTPVGAMQSPVYLSVVILTVIFGFILVRLHHYLFKLFEEAHLKKWWMRPLLAKNVLVITDAMGLAAFTVSGVIVTLVGKADPLWLWGPFFAFLTGAGGGILRDLISKGNDISVLKGDFYAEIAVVWGFLLSLALLLYTTHDVYPEFIQNAILITVLGVFVTRLVVHFYKVPNIYMSK